MYSIHTEEDEDIILKRTELGRYLARADVTGFPYKIFSDEVLEEEMEMNTSADRTVLIANNDYDNTHESRVRVDSSVFEDYENKMVEKFAEAYHRFSREHRLVLNSKYLQEKINQFLPIVKSIEDRTLAILEGMKNFQQPDTRCLLDLSTEFFSASEMIKNLMKVEELLLIQITQPKKDEKYSKSDLQYENCDDLVEPPILILRINDEQPSAEDKCTFETTETTIDCLELCNEMVGQDEIYEIKKNTMDKVTEDRPMFTTENVEGDFVATQRIVLAELKTALRPRRTDMINREIEAYIRTYGTIPEQVEESEFIKIPKRKTTKFCTYPDPASQDQNVQSSHPEKKITEAEEIYEDGNDVIEDECLNYTQLLSINLFPPENNFLTTLQNALEGRRGDVFGGLVPIYKKDSDSESESN